MPFFQGTSITDSFDVSKFQIWTCKCCTHLRLLCFGFLGTFNFNHTFHLFRHQFHHISITSTSFFNHGNPHREKNSERSLNGFTFGLWALWTEIPLNLSAVGCDTTQAWKSQDVVADSYHFCWNNRNLNVFYMFKIYFIILFINS